MTDSQQPNISKPISFDVIIAGGAMAGATLALALQHLSQGKLKVAVIEAFATDHSAHPSFDARSIALSYGTVQILQELQLWPSLQPFATAIKHIHVSDQSHAGMTDIHCETLGVSALGYVVELADVGRVYAERMAQCSAIQQFVPSRVVNITREQESVTVQLDTKETLQGKLLVAADGALSTCCQALGLAMQEHDFEQVALIANITSAQPHVGRAFERFTPHGPVALLPMSQDRLSLVWCLPPEQVAHWLHCSEAEFLQGLQQAFGWRLGALTHAGERSVYPLVLRYREQTVSHRFAMVGNAAQTLHPIAGQGFNLGIRDVATLAEEITRSDDAGEYALLQRYFQRRQADRSATISLTTGLVHTFSNDWLAMRMGRNLGLMAMDNLPLLKAPLLRRTLGIVNR
ncbi:TPA: 2-octaprenyl-6-methoxyphenyl hydroxylase [Vibrio cholerae]|uniref:2-octaprenyl-6-methoxyphenyl hydroxylase n=1 Tax=Vibrio cholerae TaxID=666 RepID=UPI00226EA636|nr:2-octaprenyl-6-methoxyphenyl hydroxylase [Vibrio cholerae]MCX9451632.1 2-octaprenyl-6-methoxyphenyl hydroxylase [Vibrio cholerae]MEB5621799.1 2-octaprenyl-6-methoxyphenyl hydroxylase [Vibrio cholerae]HDL9438987.1 2-octaprenyl-6-methoxyphenyl hydroxylase [Vibrio cholerae]